MKEQHLTHIGLIPSEGKAKRRLIFEQKNSNGYTTYYIFTVENDNTHGDFYAISEMELQEVERKIYSGTQREFRSKEILPDIKAHIKEYLPYLETVYNQTKGEIRLLDVCFILYRQEKLDYRSGDYGRILFARKTQRIQTSSNTPAQQSKASSTKLTEKSREDMYKFLREVAKQLQSETKNEWLSKGEVSKRLEKYLEDHKFKKYDGKFRKLVADSKSFETKPDDSQRICFKRK